uniref:phosphoserine phosphatase n=1 Tax=Ignisphaera aggregans TaxID=334771 RepID=A0A7J3Z516_9CREN
MVLVVAFDVDGTLTPISSSWLFMHLMLNSLYRAKKNFKLFVEGHISYDEWIYRELSLWAGVLIRTFNRILSHLPWRNGIEELVKVRQKHRSSTLFIAVSGGFSFLGERAVRELGFDDYIMVVPKTCNGVLTGHAEQYIDLNGKGEALMEYVKKRLEIEKTKLICVGDNINDVEMFKLCDFSIAFCFNKKLYEYSRYIDVFLHTCSVRSLAKLLDEVIITLSRE